MESDKDSLSEYRNMTFVLTQFETLDALVIFVPNGNERDSLVQEYSEKFGQSRWFSVEGGYKVYFPFDDETKYNKDLFQIEKGAWNHDHCDACGGTIDESVSCWITDKEPFVLICEQCHQKL